MANSNRADVHNHASDDAVKSKRQHETYSDTDRQHDDDLCEQRMGDVTRASTQRSTYRQFAAAKNEEVATEGVQPHACEEQDHPAESAAHGGQHALSIHRPAEILFLISA